MRFVRILYLKYINLDLLFVFYTVGAYIFMHVLYERSAYKMCLHIFIKSACRASLHIHIIHMYYISSSDATLYVPWETLHPVCDIRLVTISKLSNASKDKIFIIREKPFQSLYYTFLY